MTFPSPQELEQKVVPEETSLPTIEGYSIGGFYELDNL